MLKKGQIITDEYGTAYTLVKKLGAGGQAVVWKVRNNKSGKCFAYKHYRHNTKNVRSNIEDLKNIGVFKDKDGKELDYVILPMSLVEHDGDAFGYIMELVDLKDFTTLPKAWCGEYPDAKAICRILGNLAHVFETLHTSYGMCYKDVNEGNIFFNPKTGEIRIIDNDNIGYASKFTIKGTSRYMAPEICLGEKPTHNSDRFSLAVYAFRLLTGGYPFDGPYTERYCQEHNMLAKDAAPVIYGSDARFIWNPADTSNSIENSSDPRRKGQVTYWKRIPQPFKDLFMSTFVTNLKPDRRAERPTNTEWIDTCRELEAETVVCRHCGTVTFGTDVCFECGRKIRRKSTPKPIVKPTSVPVPAPVQAHRRSVTFRILSAGEAKKEICLNVADTRSGQMISKNLPDGELFRILYSKKQKKLGIRNLSTSAWTIVHADKTKATCAPGDVQALEEGMMIRIIPKTAQLNVLKIE